MVKKIFVPGEEVATEKEYSAGFGTYKDDGKIKASVIGEADFDKASKRVNIKSKLVKNVSYNDIVYGHVSMVKDSMVVVDLIKAENGKVICNTRANLPVRNVSKEFVENISDFYKLGDFIKAKISNIDKYSTDLATNEKGLGAMNAYCGKCKSNLVFSNGKMMCLNCGNVEKRKWFEADDVAKPREHRNDRFDSREGGFRPRNNFRNDRNSHSRGNFSGNRNNNKSSEGRNFRGGHR